MAGKVPVGWGFGDAWGVRWFWRRKKKVAEEEEPRRRRRADRDEVKELRAKLTSQGYTIHH